MQTVDVDLGPRSYSIQIGAGNLPGLGRFLADCAAIEHAVVITDDHVEHPHAERAAESLVESGTKVDVLVVESGEESKSVDTAAGLWNKLLELGVDRRSLLVAVGGGVIGDLAGFVAATFARGIAFAQVPTTLLAQVDSSVGGKTGINLPGAKNIVGAFWQPLAVLVDTEVLATLPDRDYRSGLAEVVKYGVILDADFFAYLEANVPGLTRRDPLVLEHVIARCCRLKADVVEQDEREQTGSRAVLNYGHTFGHAIETVTHYQDWLHGEAVSVGMLCASRLAERLGLIPDDLTQRQARLLSALGLPTALPTLDPRLMLTAMGRDKKNEQGRLRFVLPTRLGHVQLVDNVPSDDVRAILKG